MKTVKANQIDYADAARILHRHKSPLKAYEAARDQGERVEVIAVLRCVCSRAGIRLKAS